MGGSGFGGSPAVSLSPIRQGELGIAELTVVGDHRLAKGKAVLSAEEGFRSIE